MKKFIYIALFILVFFIGDRVLSLSIAHIVINSGVNLSLIYTGKLNNDIVILGNSRGVASFSPSDISSNTGKKTFQLSHNGFSTEIIEVFWADYLTYNKPPSLVIVELSNIFTSNDIIHSIKGYSYWSNNLSDKFKQLERKSYMASRLSNLFLWNGEILFKSLYYLNRTEKEVIKFKTRRLSSELDARLMFKKMPPFRIRERNLDALERIVELSKQYDCDVYLVFTPFYIEYEKRIDDIKIELLNEITKRVGNKVKILDYSTAITDINAFEDLTHLNYLGSQLLLNRMIDDRVLSSL